MQWGWHLAPCVKALERTIYTGNLAYLFASVFGCLLVWLSLLSSVQGVFLVELEHLHLLLDGIHGCLVLVIPQTKNKRNWFKGSERLNTTGRQAGVRAGLGCSESNMYFGWPVTGHPILFWKQGQLPAKAGPDFFLVLFGDSLSQNIWLLCLYKGHERHRVTPPSHQDVFSYFYHPPSDMQEVEECL